MSKMRYFSNKFSKIAKRWRLSIPSALCSILVFWWSADAWFGQIMFFKTNYDKIEH